MPQSDSRNDNERKDNDRRSIFSQWNFLDEEQEDINLVKDREDIAFDGNNFLQILVFNDMKKRKENGEKEIALNKELKDVKDEDLHIYAKEIILNSEKLVEEVEIDDGVLCSACGKKSARDQPSQLRASDEGSGILRICSRRNCKHVQVISR